MTSEYTPRNIVKNTNGANNANSNLVKSLKCRIELFFILPKSILLSSQSVYPAPRTIPVPHRSAIQLLVSNDPDITRNSPIKLLVPGKPRFPRLKVIKHTENRGIV